MCCCLPKPCWHSWPKSLSCCGPLFPLPRAIRFLPDMGQSLMKYLFLLWTNAAHHHPPPPSSVATTVVVIIIIVVGRLDKFWMKSCLMLACKCLCARPCRRGSISPTKLLCHVVMAQLFLCLHMLYKDAAVISFMSWPCTCWISVLPCSTPWCPSTDPLHQLYTRHDRPSCSTAVPKRQYVGQFFEHRVIAQGSAAQHPNPTMNEILACTPTIIQIMSQNFDNLSNFVFHISFRYNQRAAINFGSYVNCWPNTKLRFEGVTNASAVSSTSIENLPISPVRRDKTTVNTLLHVYKLLARLIHYQTKYLPHAPRGVIQVCLARWLKIGSTSSTVPRRGVLTGLSNCTKDVKAVAPSTICLPRPSIPSSAIIQLFEATCTHSVPASHLSHSVMCGQSTIPLLFSSFPSAPSCTKSTNFHKAANSNHVPFLIQSWAFPIFDRSFLLFIVGLGSTWCATLPTNAAMRTPCCCTPFIYKPWTKKQSILLKNGNDLQSADHLKSTF